MTAKIELKGVVSAIVTPLRDGKLDLGNLQRHVRTMAAEGCDGVLLLGTTGEGPSFGVSEREAIIGAVLDVAGEMMVMAGTGFPALNDTVQATRRAFEMGARAVVIVPPYYYKKVSDKGLFEFYKRVLDDAVPDEGLLILYHIPQVSGVPVTFGLIEMLLSYDERRVAGIKDTAGDIGFAQEVVRRFPGFRVFVGTDRLLLDGLKAGAAGCITAAANILAPLAVATNRAFHSDDDAEGKQALLSAARAVVDRYQPLPPILKSLLAMRYGNEGWDVRPPLDAVTEVERDAFVEAVSALDLPEAMRWLKC